jgi:hypothetical protein
MEVLHHTPGIEPERVVLVGPFVVINERQGNQFGLATRGYRFIVGVQSDRYGAAGGAVTTGRVTPFPDALISDLDGVLFVTSDSMVFSL